jgi:vacuolar-type H+-ATPase subunit E/Vma4
LINQKKSVQDQIQNTKNVIASTKANFSYQLNSLNSQKKNIEAQIALLEQNLAKLKEQKNY